MIVAQNSFKSNYFLVFSSVQSLSRVLFFSPHESQHARPPCPSPTPGVYSNSCQLSQWCHPTISSSVVPFSSCPQPLPPEGSFLMSVNSSHEVAKVLEFQLSISPSNGHPGLISFRWAGWISLNSKGLSRVFSNTTVQKHHFFGAQLSLKSNSHIHTWLLGKT